MIFQNTTMLYMSAMRTPQRCVIVVMNRQMNADVTNMISMTKGGMQIMSRAVSHTAYPNGEIVKHLFGMPKPEVICYGEIMKKAAFKSATQNLPKKGGVCFEDQQESLLDQAKELLTLNPKRR